MRYAPSLLPLLLLRHPIYRKKPGPRGRIRKISSPSADASATSRRRRRQPDRSRFPRGTTSRPGEGARRKRGAGVTTTTTTTTNSDDVDAPSRVSAPSRDRRVLSLRCDGSRRERFLRHPLLEKNSRFSCRLRVRYSRHENASSKPRHGRPSIPVREIDRQPAV